MTFIHSFRRGAYRTLLGIGILLWLGACSEPNAKLDLQLQDVHGQPVSLRALGHRPTVVNVWASWCGPCRREMPLLQQFQQRHPEIQFVFINQGESVAAVQTFLSRQQWQLSPIWLDPSFKTRQVLAYQGLPATYFFDAQGRLVQQSVGELDAPQLQHWLQRIR